jgi:4-amino-4-deoxy-L-arabinose transferase-like glycosyltransferase
LRNYPLFAGLAFVLLAAVPFFYDLGAFPIFQWDEARYVNNALEMRATGDPWIVRMDGAVDTWNFKPPLVLWLQALSMSVFGPTEWAARLPSALAGLGIVALLYWFCYRVLGTLLAGATSTLFFLASWGFLAPHTGRTADLDAVQTFFLVAYALLFLRFLLAGGRAARVFPAMGALVVAAFLCKGLPGFFYLPFLVLIALLPSNFPRLWREPALYASAAGAIALCVAYYAVRAWQDPAYWQLLRASEFNRFSGKGVEWHVQPFGFYRRNFSELQRFYPLVWYLLLTPVAYFAARTARIRRAVLYFAILAAGHFLLISATPVKLQWYDAPLYPLFALLLGLTVSEGLAWLWSRPAFARPPAAWRVPVSLALTVVLCLPAYRYIARQVRYTPDKMSDWEYEGVLFRRLREQFPQWRHYTVLRRVSHEEHLDAIKFYRRSYGERFGYAIAVVDDPVSLASGDTVMVCREADRIRLDSARAYRLLYEEAAGRVVVMQ